LGPLCLWRCFHFCFVFGIVGIFVFFCISEIFYFVSDNLIGNQPHLQLYGGQTTISSSTASNQRIRPEANQNKFQQKIKNKQSEPKQISNVSKYQTSKLKQLLTN